MLAVALLLASATSAVPVVDQIIVDKSDRTLVLSAGGQPVLTIRDIRLGGAPQGHKQFEGDERTPEGEYSVDMRNPRSHYHRSLRISYPNAADRQRAAQAGRAPGGDIFIHGQPNYSPFGRLWYDWTDGCIAVSDAEMDQIWRLVRTGTRITIQP